MSECFRLENRHCCYPRAPLSGIAAGSVCLKCQTRCKSKDSKNLILILKQNPSGGWGRWLAAFCGAEILQFLYEYQLIMQPRFIFAFYRICPSLLSGSITKSVCVPGKLGNMPPQEPPKVLGLLALLHRKGAETCPRSPKEICTRLTPESFILVTEMLISSTNIGAEP